MSDHFRAYTRDMIRRHGPMPANVAKAAFRNSGVGDHELPADAEAELAKSDELVRGDDGLYSIKKTDEPAPSA